MCARKLLDGANPVREAIDRQLVELLFKIDQFSAAICCIIHESGDQEAYSPRDPGYALGRGGARSANPQRDILGQLPIGAADCLRRMECLA